MRWRGLLLGPIVVVAACSGSAESSTTTAVPDTTTTSTATTVVETTTTTAAVETTTTLDQAARRAEVEVIVDDLLFRWFDAIHRQDEEALRSVAATVQYFESSREVFEIVETDPYLEAPSPDNVVVEVLAVHRDDPDCLVVEARGQATALLGPTAVAESVYVLWPLPGAQWGTASVWGGFDETMFDDCPSGKLNGLEELSP